MSGPCGRRGRVLPNPPNPPWVRAWGKSKYWLFATFARLFLSPCSSSRCLPSFASRQRLLCQPRRRSIRIPYCQSGVDLADLGAKNDYEEMLAKLWKLGTEEDGLVIWPNVQANFPEQRCAQAGPLTGYIALYARWVNFWCFAKACNGKSF